MHTMVKGQVQINLSAAIIHATLSLSLNYFIHTQFMFYLKLLHERHVR